MELEQIIKALRQWQSNPTMGDFAAGLQLVHS
jgi:hypothetical protein